jgi:hypothetical protein
VTVRFSRRDLLYNRTTRRHNPEDLDLKLIVLQLLKKFPPFIEPEGSLQY